MRFIALRRRRPASERGAVGAALGFAVASALLLAALPARASSTGVYLDTIPNGNRISCVGCHTDDVGPDLNPFGTSILGTLNAPVDAGGMPNWAEVRALDSDGDGQSNGQELGDPCGTWQVGQPEPRITGISNPGIAAALSPTPDEPSCSGDDDGGCSVVGSAAGLSGAAVALVLLTLAMPVRRRTR
jgi:hypothetical protein